MTGPEVPPLCVGGLFVDSMVISVNRRGIYYAVPAAVF